MARPKGSKNKNPRPDKGRPRKKKLFCINGHEIAVVGRTKSGSCIQCSKDYYITHRDFELNAANEWNRTHRERMLTNAKIYYDANKEKILIERKKWKEEHKEEYLEYHRKWRSDHSDSVQASHIKNKTNRQLRVVAWTDWPEINKFIRNKPKEMTADHYIPLQGKLVWGLHVSWNLQYLTRSENARKYNKTDLIEISKWYGKILEKAGLK
jgi:hypothetical protein